MTDLAMWVLLAIGGGFVLAVVVLLGMLVHPLTAPTARAYGVRIWGVFVKWAPVLLALVGAAGLALALERFLRGGDIPPTPDPDLPDPVPSSEPEREAIRTETRREVAEIEDLRAREGVTIGEMRRGHRSER